MDDPKIRSAILHPERQKEERVKKERKREGAERDEKAKLELQQQQLKSVRTRITHMIKHNNLCEPSEIPKCITRATFYLIEEMKTHELTAGGNSTTLPPFHTTFLSMLETEEEETLNAVVKEICFRPRANEAGYYKWLKAERDRRFPKGNYCPERGMQMGSFGYNELSQMGKDMGSFLLSQAKIFVQNKAVSGASALISTVSDDVITLFGQGSTTTSVASTAIKTSAKVTGGYVLCVTGYNVYRVVRHGRSWRFAVKNIIDEGGNVACANAVGAVVLVSLLPVMGGISALLLGVAAGASAACFLFNPLLGWISRKMFNVSKDEYLDKACRHLGVKQTDKLDEIARKYRKLSRDHHEDKIGSKNKRVIEYHRKIFHKTQYAMAMVTAAIGKNQDDYDVARFNFRKADKESYGKDYVSEISNGIKELCKKVWPFGKKKKDPRILAIKSGQLPIELFLEEEELETERNKTMQLRRAGNNDTEMANANGMENEVGEAGNEENEVDDLENLLGGEE